jgi:hypothetical protein
MLRRQLALVGVLAVWAAGAADAAPVKTAVRISVTSQRVEVAASCPAAAAGGCREDVVLAVRNRRIGQATRTLTVGQRGRVVVRLNAMGRELLRRHRSFRATARVTSTVLPSPPPPAPLPCVQPSSPVLPPTGPGPTGVTGGIQIVGGPPSCDGGTRPWGAGTVVAKDETGKVVASQDVAAGQTFTMALPAGPYMLHVAGNEQFCSSNGVVTVQDGQTTAAIVYCQVP